MPQQARTAFHRLAHQPRAVDHTGADAAAFQRVAVGTVEQMLGLRAQRGAAREGGIGLRPALAKLRQYLQAQEIAVGIVTGVAGVFDPLQTFGLRMCTQGAARNLQQRPPHSTGAECAGDLHRRQPIHAGAAQRPQQEGLGLVVAVMGQCQPLARQQL
ncbi:hypothetical protein D3C71_1133480 [compost metagenome]